ncbi:MAG TPA: hypothetical protein VEI01_06845 [Terriglobales bacterium]|nr:hypothetical protein [Terriglobales bacterium]
MAAGVATAADILAAGTGISAVTRAVATPVGISAGGFTLLHIDLHRGTQELNSLAALIEAIRN